MIFAIDFDGTIVEDKFCYIGKENIFITDFIRAVQKSPIDKWILWTMREGETLQEALDWLKERGLFPDAVNDNLPELKEKYGNNPRKVFAECYIDDRGSCINFKDKTIVTNRDVCREMERIFKYEPQNKN